MPSAAGSNTKVLCNFDGDNPLGSPLFPKARWEVGTWNFPVGAVCNVGIDSTQAALGTARSMRWDYQVANGEWIQIVFDLTGAWQPMDLTMYDSLSFYVKSLKPAGLGFVINAKPVREGGED